MILYEIFEITLAKSKYYIKICSKIFNWTGIYLLTAINLLVFGKFHNIFVFGIPFLPESWFLKTAIFLNWLFGFAFLPAISFLIFSYAKKQYKKFLGILTIAIGLDIFLNILGKTGGIGFIFSLFLKPLYSGIFGIILIIGGNFLLTKTEKTQPKIRKIREISTKPELSPTHLPSPELLQIGEKIAISINTDSQKKVLMQTLKDFGIDAKIVEAKVGPVVTLYSVELAAGIKSARLINLADDIARSIETFSARIAAIPGKNLIGIEISNEKRQMVYFKEGILSATYRNFSGNLPLYLGVNIYGEHEVFDLSAMPHLLVAGTTGSGKSVGIHTMLLSLLFSRTPAEMKLILVDPKKLELTPYEDIPHLLLPVVTEAKQAVTALKWAVKEMEDRYRKMSKIGVRNIVNYNSKKAEDEENLAFIVIVVDEMADLMLLAGKEIEICVQRLAQMGRAAGLHIVMATQRPSVDVVTGTIKANFPTRISFKLSSKIDSRTILGDMSGAEQLLGSGDMLYLATNGKLTRIHGSFVSEEDVMSVVEFWKQQGQPMYIELPEEDDADSGKTGQNGEFNDEYYQDAIALIRSTQKISTSFLQRNFPIGYNRAAKIIEQMEKDGIISKGDKFGRNRELL